MDEVTQQDAGERFDWTAPPEAEGQRADKALAGALADWSRERLQVLFDAGEVMLNGRPAAKRARLASGDVLSVVLPPPEPSGVEPMAVPLPVLHEDEWLVAVDKPAGMVTHPGAGVVPPTLCHALLHHTGGRLARAGGEERPGVVHRLDKDTTGVIVFAKTDEAYYALVRAFAERQTRKEYFALVAGNPDLDAGSLREPIERDLRRRTCMAVRPDGKPAHTDWRVEERLDGRHCLVHCQIHTGRTHQIRVHLSHAGMPLLGDRTYGYRPRDGETWPPRVFLHAGRLELPHPGSGETLALQALLPDDFCAWRERLRSARR